MSILIKFLKSSGIYFVGNVLTKLVSFFLLPLYTTHIPPNQSGYFDLSYSVLSVLVPIVFLEIWSAIMRYTFDYNDEEDQFKVLFNGMLIFIGSLIIFTIGAFTLGSFIQIDYLPYVFLYGVFTALQTCYSYIVRTYGYNITFAISGIIGSIINSLSNIIMILIFHMQITSLYLASIFGLFVQVIIMEWKMKVFSHFSFRLFDKNLIKQMIIFSLPLALNTACFWFLSGYNRVGISNLLGLDATGVYSIAAKFTYVIGLVSNCFSLAWQELVYSMGNRNEEKSKLYSVASNYYIKFLMFGLLLLLPLVQLVFPLFVKNQYMSAYSLIPLYLLATVASIYSGFLGNIFSAEKKNNIIFNSTIVAAIVNVSLFHILVSVLGIQAANIALFCGFFVNIIMRLLLLRQSVSIHLNYKMIIFTFTLFGVLFAIYMTNNYIINGISFVVIAVITLYSFRDLISLFINKVRKR
mgnify:CR=1 FL=1